MIIAMAYLITMKSQSENHSKLSGNSQDVRVNRFSIQGNEITQQNKSLHLYLFLCSSLRFKIIKGYVTWLVIVITKLLPTSERVPAEGHVKCM